MLAHAWMPTVGDHLGLRPLGSHPRPHQFFETAPTKYCKIVGVAIMGYKVMLQESWTTLQPSKVSTYINVSYSVRKSQQELVSKNCRVSMGVAMSALG